VDCSIILGQNNKYIGRDISITLPSSRQLQEETFASLKISVGFVFVTGVNVEEAPILRKYGKEIPRNRWNVGGRLAGCGTQMEPGSESQACRGVLVGLKFKP
jgi:hypothetical protein